MKAFHLIHFFSFFFSGKILELTLTIKEQWNTINITTMYNKVVVFLPAILFSKVVVFLLTILFNNIVAVVPY
ncbi:hypothetical protein J2Y03_004669 [Neobacillus niacini]|nr:hypothetical protein [Neobacillus niacini]